MTANEYLEDIEMAVEAYFDGDREVTPSQRLSTWMWYRNIHYRSVMAGAIRARIELEKMTGRVPAPRIR